MNWKLSLVTRKFSYQTPCLPCQTRPDYSVSPIGFFHGSSDKPREPSLQTTISSSVFFFLISPRCGSISLLNRRWLFLFRCKSHFTLKMRCKMTASCRQAVYPPFPGNKRDEEKGCRLKIGTVPSWRKTFYFGSCKWVVQCRNGLGTVPKIWRAVPNF